MKRWQLAVESAGSFDVRITFEGEHRSGKGTQIKLYKEVVSSNPLVVRGDGSYQGGLEEILSEEEIAFRNHLNERLYKKIDNSDVLWGIAATACAMTVRRPELSARSLLIDRGPLSRASFLLSRGKSGDELLKAMYPGFTYEANGRTFRQDAIDVESVDFGRVIYIQVPSSILLSRVSDDDPKAEFRRRNIRDKEGLFDRAITTLPATIQDSIEVIDGNQSPYNVLKSYTEIR
jgi:thymidylate kinase